MSETNLTTIRLYEHGDTRARVVECSCGYEGTVHEVAECGWDYQVGGVLQVRTPDADAQVEIVSLTGIQTGDARGNYVEAECRDVLS